MVPSFSSFSKVYKLIAAISNFERDVSVLIVFSNILQFFSTYLTSKFGAKLFTTPVSFATPKREESFYNSAQNKILFIPSIKKNIERHLNFLVTTFSTTSMTSY